jgi:hypothetical protein
MYLRADCFLAMSVIMAIPTWSCDSSGSNFLNLTSVSQLSRSQSLSSLELSVKNSKLELLAASSKKTIHDSMEITTELSAKNGYEDLCPCSCNAHDVMANNNQIIDSLVHYHTTFNELLPFLKEIIISNQSLLSAAEFSKFTRVYEAIIHADKDLKKKLYGE